MPQFDPLPVSETLAMVVPWLVLSCFAALLMVVVFSNRFPRFRSFLRWSLARWIDPGRFEQGSYLHEVALALVVWLDPLQHRFTLHAVSAADKRGNRTPVGEAEILVERTLKSPSCDYELGRPIGTSRAYQAYQTNDQDYLIKLASDAAGNRVLRREAFVLDRLRSGAQGTSYQDYLPHRLERFHVGDRIALVYPHDTARWFSARQIRAIYRDGVGGEHIAWMFNRMLEIIGFAHQMGTVHCAVMPQHLLFDVKAHGLSLVDWTHAKRCGDRITFVPRRYRRWYPRGAYRVAEPSLDIYMSAKSTLWLAGGELSESRCTNSLPRPMQQFLNSCLLDSANMRPRDAWELHEEFRELLVSVYGEPSFHELSMSLETTL